MRRLYEPPDGDPAARGRVESYLEELRATQRHSIYRALKHPLYPILRKVERVAEGLPNLLGALDTGRVVHVGPARELLADEAMVHRMLGVGHA